MYAMIKLMEKRLKDINADRHKISSIKQIE